MFVTILLAPFGIALGLLVFGVLGLIAIPLYVRGYFEHRDWLRKMRMSKRILTSTEIKDRGGSGTLIIDQPGWGGKTKYCWWTPDDIATLAPVRITPLTDRIESLKSRIDPDDLAFDRWIYNNYLSRSNGKAYLLTTRRGDLFASQLQTDMVKLTLIETWTAPVAD